MENIAICAHLYITTLILAVSVATVYYKEHSMESLHVILMRDNVGASSTVDLKDAPSVKMDFLDLKKETTLAAMDVSVIGVVHFQMIVTRMMENVIAGMA